MLPFNQLEMPSLVFVTLFTIFLGVVVFYRNKQSHSNILLFLLSISFALWGLINYYSLYPPFGDKLLWIRLVLLSASPQAFLFALFMHTFPAKNLKLSRKFLYIFFAVLIVQMGLAVSPFVFTTLNLVAGNTVPVSGWGMPFYATSLVFFFGFGIYWLFRKALSNNKDRKEMVIVFSGFIGTAILLLTFLLFAVVFLKNTSFIPLSPVFVLPFTISASYALLRSKIFNIRLIATEFLTGILTIVLLTEAVLSENWFTIIWKLFFSLLVGALGYLLVRSVRKEIERRQDVARLAHSLEKANLQLKELDQQKTEFLSIASHQLRTPLSVLKGYIELIQDGVYGKPTKEILQVLANMDKSNERLVKLIDNFLDISRIEQGRTKYIFQDANLNELINGVVNELHERSSGKGLKIQFTPAKEGDSLINIDEEKVRHVVFNFVDNAIKYSDKGVIKVSTEPEYQGLTVRIKDDGLGFDEVDQANLFQKFYRGENVKGVNVDGTGLGLYVCRKFIEAHNGRIWAHSKGKGHGSEFGFWLPHKR